MAAPKLRFEKYNEVWNSYKLIDIAKIYDGTHQTPNYVEQGVPFYSVEHVTANDFSNTKFIAEEVYQSELKRVSLQKGDILMTRIGDIGTSRLIDWDVRASFYVSLALIKVTGKNNSVFINQYIKSRQFQKELHDRTIHVAFPKKINLGEIGLCKIQLPEIEEQTKIASFLSAVDEKISQLTQKQQLLSQYKQGMMQQLFSQQIRFKADDGGEFGEWEETTLGKIVNFHNGKRIPLSETERQNRQGTYRYFGASGVIDYVDDYLFDGQYILIGEDGANILTRSTALAFVVQGQFWVNNHAHIFQSKSGNNFFLAAYLESLNYEKFNSGTAQPKLNLENLKKVPVINPCLAEQTKIANFLSSIDQKIEVVAQQIEQAKQWKKGLLQQMFV